MRPIVTQHTKGNAHSNSHSNNNSHSHSSNNSPMLNTTEWILKSQRNQDNHDINVYRYTPQHDDDDNDDNDHSYDNGGGNDDNGGGVSGGGSRGSGSSSGGRGSSSSGVNSDLDPHPSTPSYSSSHRLPRRYRATSMIVILDVRTRDVPYANLRKVTSHPCLILALTLSCPLLIFPISDP